MFLDFWENLRRFFLVLACTGKLGFYQRRLVKDFDRFSGSVRKNLVIKIPVEEVRARAIVGKRFNEKCRFLKI